VISQRVRLDAGQISLILPTYIQIIFQLHVLIFLIMVIFLINCYFMIL
jgi:hypothetical protein